jgi:hypothetical protein
MGGPALPSNSNCGHVPDNRILDYCLFLARRNNSNSNSIVLLTGDRNLALKATAEEVRNISVLRLLGEFSIVDCLVFWGVFPTHNRIVFFARKGL